MANFDLQMASKSTGEWGGGLDLSILEFILYVFDITTKTCSDIVCMVGNKKKIQILIKWSHPQLFSSFSSKVSVVKVNIDFSIFILWSF